MKYIPALFKGKIHTTKVSIDTGRISQVPTDKKMYKSCNSVGFDYTISFCMHLLFHAFERSPFINSCSLVYWEQKARHHLSCCCPFHILENKISSPFCYQGNWCPLREHGPSMKPIQPLLQCFHKAQLYFSKPVQNIKHSTPLNTYMYYITV